MSKELVVELRIPLPTDLFEQADVVGKAKACMDAIDAALPAEIERSVTSEIIARRTVGPSANGAAKPRQRSAGEAAPETVAPQ